MEIPLNRIEDSYYEDKRRRQGIARLAIHSSFERVMAEADSGVGSREDAIAKARNASEAIMSHMGVSGVSE